ncbi:MAG TPA: DUF6600 domain-containing protein [Polyangiaceae bacterium]
MVQIRQRIAIAVVAFASALTGHATSPRLAHAGGPTDDGASEDMLSNPDQGATEVALSGDVYADTDPSALTDFQPVLDPYGTWAEDPTYGTVWTPNPDEVGADFQPYLSAGHWAYDDDYVWVSDYNWGWAAFHYGRWAWIQGRGWAWIPGRQYANAWVSWRVGDDAAYLGWAPAAPVWGWRDGVAGMLGFASREPFVFCPSNDVFAPSIAPRIVRGEPATAVMAHTRPYVKASPTVGPSYVPPSGPPPASLGIDPSRVARIGRTDASLIHARQFARPSTALALGARAPVVHIVRPRLVTRQYIPQRAAAATRPVRRK